MSTPPLATTPEACAAAIAALPGIGPVSLEALLASAGGDPVEAWRQVVSGEAQRPSPRGQSATGADAPAVKGSWAARAVDPERAWMEASRHGVKVTWRGMPGYPAALAADPEPPPVLFWRGDITCLQRPCAAVVGTRHCTPEGRRMAADLGRDLAAAGACVVSGLALGIDGSAHRGALSSGADGATVGVAASGADRPYPARHAGLWEEVVAAGAVISETAPGQPAQRWRFPARNRMIAGLVAVVVVVESHAAGGSLLTVEAALRRGVEVRAVPGPVRSPASAGTNQLLFDGAAPVRDAADVLDVLGLDLRRRAGAVPAAQRRAHRPAGAAGAALAAVGWAPATLNRLATTSGMALPDLLAALEQLRSDGLVDEESGWWRRLR